MYLEAYGPGSVSVDFTIRLMEAEKYAELKSSTKWRGSSKMDVIDCG